MAVTLPGTIDCGTAEVGGSTDLTGKEGYCVVISSDKAILASAVTDAPVFVLTKGSAVGAQAGLGMGQCHVWVTENTVKGSPLRAHTDGTWQLANAGSDVVTAEALEKVTAGTGAWCRAFVFSQNVRTI